MSQYPPPQNVRGLTNKRREIKRITNEVHKTPRQDYVQILPIQKDYLTEKIVVPYKENRDHYKK